MKQLGISLCTAIFAAAGFYLGDLIHGAGSRTWFAMFAGGLGGFVMSYVGIHVLNLWKSQNRKFS